MDFTQYAMAAFVLIGLVNGVQFALNRDWRAFTYFLVALVAGAIFGFLGYFGLPSVEIGIAVGLSSSGVYKVAQKISGV